MTLYLDRELTITSKVQECCGREFAAKLSEFAYSLKISPFTRKYAVVVSLMPKVLQEDHGTQLTLMTNVCYSRIEPWCFYAFRRNFAVFCHELWNIVSKYTCSPHSASRISPARYRHILLIPCSSSSWVM